MNLANAIGSLAAVLTTCAFVPQVLKIWKTRAARDISLPMYLIFSVGVASWIVYGVIVQSWPVIVANTLTLILSLAVIAMKWKWRQASPDAVRE